MSALSRRAVLRAGGASLVVVGAGAPSIAALDPFPDLLRRWRVANAAATAAADRRHDVEIQHHEAAGGWPTVTFGVAKFTDVREIDLVLRPSGSAPRAQIGRDLKVELAEKKARYWADYRAACGALVDEEERLSEIAGQLFEEIEERPATTVAGIAAKIETALFVISREDDYGREILTGLLADLDRLAGGAG